MKQQYKTQEEQTEYVNIQSKARMKWSVIYNKYFLYNNLQFIQT